MTLDNARRGLTADGCLWAILVADGVISPSFLKGIWKRRGAAVELPAAAAATRASAVAGVESGHGGGTSSSGPRRSAPQERYQVVVVQPYK